MTTTTIRIGDVKNIVRCDANFLGMSVFVADAGFWQAVLARLKAMTAKKITREDAGMFLSYARQMVNRQAPWNKAKMHWQTFMVDMDELKVRSFEVKAARPVTSIAIEDAEFISSCLMPVESVA